MNFQYYITLKKEKPLGDKLIKLMDGKAFRDELVKNEFIPRVKGIQEQFQTTPRLTTILVGENPASQVYVRNKIKLAERVGIEGKQINLPENTSFKELQEIIHEQNTNPEVTGILLQLPLPSHLKPFERKAINFINHLKDVDGLTNQNQGALLTGDKGIIPCTPLGILKLLKRYNIPLQGKNAVVMGRSILVGKPMGLLLLREHATVTYTHSRTKNLNEITRRADILIVAIGKPEFVTSEYVKDGAVIVDVGINRNEKGKLVGDVLFEEVKSKASYITPVPGGIGPMTVAMLMNNTIEAFYLQHEEL